MAASSDDEMMAIDSRVQELVPKEVVAARRSAAAALGVSVLVFGLMLGLVIRTQDLPQQQAAVQSPGASVVGLDDARDRLTALQKVRTGLSAYRGSADDIEETATPLMPTAHHLVAGSALYSQPSIHSAKVRDLPVGRKVFPLKQHTSWVQVVVPKSDFDGAAFGWLPAEGGMHTILARDVERRPARPKRHRREATQEEIDAKWEKVRKSNHQLKSQISELQQGMRQQYMSELSSSKEQAGKEALKRAKEVLNMQELHSDMIKLRNEMKELKTQPGKLLHGLSDLVE